jgi:mRNA-degrading endonuclease RelE of RelBE toxin-antitoxin system
MQRKPANVEWTSAAAQSLRGIGSRTIQQKIRDKVEHLAELDEPELLGKPLLDAFQGLYRISFGRYRIVYRVVRDPRSPAGFRIIVRVVLVGILKQGDKNDVYEHLYRMHRRGEIE